VGVSYMAGSPAILHLVDAKLSHKSTGELVRPNVKISLEQSGLDLGIYWFAIREAGEVIDTILLAPLYSEKFQKLVRKWNRTDSRFRFELRY
jgi:hypothetical protein